MTEKRYKLFMNVRGQKVVRELTLKTDEPVVYILNWLEDEYEFSASLKKVYWLRDDGIEEQIY
jgi:hypothetical protein